MAYKMATPASSKTRDSASPEIKSAPPGGFFFPPRRHWVASFSLFYAVCSALVPDIFVWGGPKTSECLVASYNLENYTLRASDRTHLKSIPAREAVADVVAEAHPDILGVCEMGLRTPWLICGSGLCAAALSLRMWNSSRDLTRTVTLHY